MTRSMAFHSTSSSGCYLVLLPSGGQHSAEFCYFENKFDEMLDWNSI